MVGLEIIEDEKLAFKRIVPQASHLGITHVPETWLGNVDDRIPEDGWVVESENVCGLNVGSNGRYVLDDSGEVGICARIIMTPRWTAPAPSIRWRVVPNTCKRELWVRAGQWVSKFLQLRTNLLPPDQHM